MAEQPTRQRLVQVGRRYISTTEMGSGDAVVMLHGGGPGTTAVSTFSRNATVLAHRFHVVLPDLPGFGASAGHGLIDQDDPFGDLASAIEGMMDALGLERASFIGHSLGGAVAIRLAMDRPERIKRLILIAPGGIGTTRLPLVPTAGLRKLFGYYTGEGATPAKLTAFMRHYLVFDQSMITDEMISERFSASIEPSIVANPPLNRPVGRRAGATLIRMDLTRSRRLSAIDTDILVVWGRDDQINRPAGAYFLARKMQHCDLHLLHNTGHWAHWERAEIFNAIAVAYLGQA